MKGSILLKFSYSLGMLLMVLVLCSCAGRTGAGTEGIEVTDALGRKVTIAPEPKRVAALLGSFADVWVLSGGKISAAPEDAWEDFGLEADDAVNIGGAHSPNLELLIASDPDLVLASGSTASNVEMRETLEAMGITVVYFDVDNFEDYLAMLDICTDITGRKDLYKKNGLDIKVLVDDIKAGYKACDIPPEERRVLLVRASSTSVKAKGSRGTILGEMLYDMGCVNIADGNDSLLENLSVESVIREEPHHIFVTTMGNDTQKALESLENMIRDNPAWGTLEAVREGRLHIMEKKLFNLKPNARFGEAYQKLYEALTRE